MLACPRYELHLHFITLFSGIFGLRKTVDFLKDYHTNLSDTDMFLALFNLFTYFLVHIG